MSGSMEPFDFERVPLRDVHAIEASAGTGKTWNLCRLYRRLITEVGYTVGEILVVTYTEAATAELKERIWQHLNEALATEAGESARLRLAQALAAFDEAAIFTIHGFCQRVLGRLAFVAGRPLGSEEVVEARTLAEPVIAEFWRRTVARLEGDEARFVLQWGPTPEQLLEALIALSSQPLAERRFSVPTTAFDPQAFAQHMSEVAAKWQQQRHEALERIARALQEKRLSGVKYKPATAAQAAAVWQAIFEGHLPSDRELDLAAKLAASALREACNKDKTPPEHPLFTALDDFLPLLHARQEHLRALPRRLFQKLAEEGPPLLEAEKARARALSFDDMLWRLYQGVAGPHARPQLIAAVRGTFRCALIDEFQDTDPVQLAIFKALFASPEAGPGPLFLIGDPKQAIYSFRGADLYSYFAGRALASHHHALNANQRSSAAMIGAVNRLFSRHEQAFRIAGLRFASASKGQKTIVPLIDDSGLDRPALSVWSLDALSAGGGLDKAGVKRRLAKLVAREIARLLAAARVGKLRYGERPLAPGDIAVLVRTHAQGALIAEALAEQGITAVRRDERDVCQSFEASEMLTVLAACAEPTHLTLLRAALATTMLGATSRDIDRLNDEAREQQNLLQRFALYHRLWLEQGFAPMWRHLLAEYGVIERLLSLPGGERRATNLLHLAELAAEAARQYVGPQALLRWLASQRATDGGEARQLRLESDDNLVQITTKHRSKGLEYPIVFCPFLWDDGRPGARSSPFLRYHDREGRLILDFAPDEAAQAQALEEQRAERLRLIYVALTRAVHRCYIAGGVRQMTSRGKLIDGEVDSMLNWLVAGGCEDWAQAERVRQAWQTLIDEGDGQIGWLDLDEKAPAVALAPPPAVRYGARSLAKPLPGQRWSVVSFSSLIRGPLGHEADSAPAADHDHHSLASQARPAEAIDDEILAFARGPEAGDCIHLLCERVDFTDRASWMPAIDLALRTHLPTHDLAAGRRALGALLDNLTARELRPGLRLATLPRTRRLSELEFCLPVRRRDAADFDRRLARHGWHGSITWPTLSGYLQGRIDLIFEHDGLWYVLDWKSNHLGDRPADYAPAALAATMRDQAYDLQALIYLVALHRHLRQRLGEHYRPEQQLGGALYLFVRGVRPAWPDAGVWHWSPPIALLDELSEFFGSGKR